MKEVLLCISGGIAAYKSLILIRLLKNEVFDVDVILTENAKKFVTKVTIEALSGNKVYDDLWKNNMDHISLSRDKEIIIIAPATANTIAKIANGFCDNLLTTTIAARKKDIPTFFAPAMNLEMWSNQPNQRNIEQLQKDDLILLPPEKGILACSEIGHGRMIEPDSIIQNIKSFLKKNI